jgi:polysaccharide export outer membrane protein
MIIVSAEDPEIAMPLILESVSVQNPGRPDAIGGQNHAAVFADANGFIEFPVLGKLKVWFFVQKCFKCYSKK